MNKKNYLLIAAIVLVIAFFSLLLFKNSNQNVKDDQVINVEHNVVDVATQVANNANQAETNVPNEPSVTDNMPLSKEALIEVTGKTFTPKIINAKAGEKVFITFLANDTERHTFNFVDADLSFILVTFNKDEGKKSINFPAPAAGTYTFFIDDKANTGKLIIE